MEPLFCDGHGLTITGLPSEIVPEVKVTDSETEQLFASLISILYVPGHKFLRVAILLERIHVFVGSVYVPVPPKIQKLSSALQLHVIKSKGS